MSRNTWHSGTGFLGFKAQQAIFNAGDFIVFGVNIADSISTILAILPGSKTLLSWSRK